MAKEQDQDPKKVPKRPAKKIPKVPPLREPTDLQPATRGGYEHGHTTKEH